MARDHRYRLEKQNPSFSSTLLDQIYNSIDDDAKFKKQSTVGTKIKKQSNFETEQIEVQRARFLEQLMEKRRVIEKADLEKTSKLYLDRDALFSSSGSNSSHSDNDSLKTTTTSSCFSIPKPIRTTRSETRTERARSALFFNSDKNNRETQKLNFESFSKPRSKSFNFHRNLKQPISPGGRIAAFLNSVFAARTGKNPKNPSLAGTPAMSRSSQPSNCSSASSFSRSYGPSRMPALTGEKPAGPVQGTGRLGLYDAVEEKRRRFEEAARGYLNRYRNDERNVQNDIDDDDNDDDDDGASCSSSDLFELDHIKVMGCDRCREELPVFETTRLDRNRVMA